MDTQSQTTRPYSHDQPEDPLRVHHPEEEEHQDHGASKMFRKVKEKAKKIKNSLTKHGQGHEHDHDDEEDDEYDEQDPEVHSAPVYESSAVRSGVTGQPESLSHLGEAKVPAPEEIIPPGTKVFPVVSSDHTRPVEPVPLRDASYGHEAPLGHLRVADMSEREESREAHHMPMHTPVSLLSATEDVTRTFAPGEDENLGGQRRVNIETPKRLEEDPAAPGGGSGYLSGSSNYQSKVTDPTHEGGGETGVPRIAESLGRMNVTDESRDQESEHGFGRDLPTRSYDEFAPKKEFGIGKDSPAGFGEESKSYDEFAPKKEFGIGKDSPAGFGGESRSYDEFAPKKEFGIGKDSPAIFGEEWRDELRKDSPKRSHEFFDQKTESRDDNSSMGYGGESGARLGEDLSTRSHGFGVKNEFGIDNNPPTGFGHGVGEDLPAESHDFGVKTDSGMEDSSMGIGGGLSTGDDFPARSHELGLENESGIGKDSSRGGYGYGEESETGLGKNFPARSDDTEVKTGLNFPARSDGVEGKTGLGSDLPTGTHDQFSPELSRPKEKDDFESKVEETQEPKPSTYTEKFASATSAISDSAIAMKNAVASRLGYSGETTDTGADQKHESPVITTDTGADQKHESSMGGEIPRSATGYGQNVAGTVAEKLSPVYEKVKETGSNVMTKLPLSGGGSGEEAQPREDKSVSTRDYLTEKLTPGEEDKALSEMISEKLHLGGGGGDGEKKSTTTTTREVEVTVEKIPSDQISERVDTRATEGEGVGMVGKIKGAVNSWLGGATEEVKPKSPSSVHESSQSLGSTVGTKGFSDSGGAGGLQQSGH